MSENDSHHRFSGMKPLMLATVLLAAIISGQPACAHEESDEATDSACAMSDKSEHPAPNAMEIRLTGDIGPDMAHQLFAEIDHHLTTYPGLKTIKILLSSGGGYVESGIAIHNYLNGLHQRYAIQVITHNVGSVQSAAVDVYCAGNQRITSPYTFFMVHDSNFDLDKGNYDVKAVRDLDEENSVTSEAGYALFSACTNLPIDDVSALFAEQTYINPDQAIKLGLAHSIQPATFDRSADIRCLIEVDDEEGDEP